MVFDQQPNALISTKDVASFVLDDPKHDVDKKVNNRPVPHRIWESSLG
jgi:hypothetical protein